MYCPNCAKENSIEQKFCRACGLSLERTVQSLSEQLPARVDESLREQKARLEKYGVAALSVFGLGFLGFVVYLAVQKIIAKGDLLTVLGMIGFLVMIVCGLAAVVLFARAKEVEKESAKQQKRNLANSNPTKELLSEGHFEPVPTVTERTTDLLAASKRDTNRH